MRMPSSLNSAAAGPARARASADVRPGLSQHGLQRAADLEPELRQRGLAGDQHAFRHGSHRPAQHHRPPQGGGGDAGGLGDRVQHHPVQRALAQLTGDQPGQQPLFGRRGAGEEGRELRAAGGLRTGAGQFGQRGERGVDLGHVERGVLGGRRQVTQGRRAEARAALA